MLQPTPITGQLSAGANTLSLGTAVFSNSNNVSFGINGQTITASVSGAGGAFSAGVSTGGNTAGSTGVSGSRMVLVGSQNITLSQSTDANGLTVSFSGGAGAAGNTGFISANATASLGTVVFSNSNGVTFGVNGQTLTASVSLTTQSAIKALGVSNTGQTAGNTGVSTGIDWVLAGSQSITLSQSTAGGGPNTIWFQHPAWLTTADLSANSSKYIQNWKLTGGAAGTTSSAQGTDLWLAGGNGVTVSGSSNTISISVNTNYQSQGNYLTTADLSANSSKYVQNWKLTGNTAGTTSSAQGTDLWFSGGNSITVSGNSNTIVLSVGAYITTADLSANSSKYVQNWKLTGNTAGTTSSAQGTDLWLSGGNSITVSGNSNTVVFSVGAYITTADLSANSSNYFRNWKLTGNTAGTTSSQQGTDFWLAGGNGITVSGNSNSITISGITQSNQTEGYYFSGNTTISSTGTMDARSVSIKGAGAVTVGFDTAASQIVISGGTAAVGSLSFYASSNTTSTSSGSGAGSISIAGAGAISIAASNSGFIVSSPVTSSLSATGMVSISTNGSTISIGAPVCVGTVTAQTNVTWTVNSAGISLNAGGYAGTVSGATNCNVTVNTSGVSVSLPYISYLDLAYIWGNTVTSSVAGSISQMIPFVAPQPISVGSVRMFQVGTVAASSTEALVNGSTLSMSGQTSHNFVFYSRGVGASSQSLQYVTSTQVVDNCLMSVQNAAGANSSQLSYTYRFSLANTSFTKDYSSTAQSYNFHTSNVTDLTGTKMVDYPCGISLSAGQWFLLYGRSTTFATQNAVISVATRLNISYDSQFIASQNTQGAIGTLGGATNSSVMFGPVGLGSFSTGGAAGTTNSINISNISSGASNQMPLMQLVRIA